ncbi:MAG: VOC family protein [Leptolyngbyaceae cyanobacterium RM1_405_57]|nr:VOC family protein [Leptolyngbyaceae cyanobacterium RM1_405_57]
MRRGAPLTTYLGWLYEKSKQFYVETLGFEVIAETFRDERNSYKLDLKVGKHDPIELFSFPSPPDRPSHPEACGLRHLAFAVEDIEKAVTELQLKGVAVKAVRIDHLTEKQFTFFQEPDGLPLEISDVRKAVFPRSATLRSCRSQSSLFLYHVLVVI